MQAVNTAAADRRYVNFVKCQRSRSFEQALYTYNLFPQQGMIQFVPIVAMILTNNLYPMPQGIGSKII